MSSAAVVIGSLRVKEYLAVFKNACICEILFKCLSIHVNVLYSTCSKAALILKASSSKIYFTVLF